MTHLIMHKVRGEPAFDIAEQCCPGPRPCQPNCGCWDGEKCSAEGEWIIPTSGHRAYPYQSWSLSHILNHISWDVPPVDWPDHYANGREPDIEVNLGDLISGLIGKFPRRA